MEAENVLDSDVPTETLLQNLTGLFSLLFAQLEAGFEMHPFYVCKHKHKGGPYDKPSFRKRSSPIHE